MRTESEALARVIKKSCTAAAAPLLRDVGELERLQLGGKNPTDFAQRTRRRVAEILQGELLSARPKFGYRDNIGNKTNGLVDEYFLVAPLVGFNNFARALPLFGSAVVVVGRADETADWAITMAGVHQPLLDDFFVADGREAFHNQKWLRLGGGGASGGAGGRRGEAQNPVIHTNQPAMGGQGGVAEQNFGAPAIELCYLAAGRIDAYHGHGLPLIETSAGLFIALVAGKKITGRGFGANPTTDTTRGTTSTSGETSITPAVLAATCAALVADQTLAVDFKAT